MQAPIIRRLFLVVVLAAVVFTACVDGYDLVGDGASTEDVTASELHGSSKALVESEFRSDSEDTAGNTPDAPYSSHKGRRRRYAVNDFIPEYKPLAASPIMSPPRIHEPTTAVPGTTNASKRPIAKESKGAHLESKYSFATATNPTTTGTSPAPINEISTSILCD